MARRSPDPKFSLSIRDGVAQDVPYVSWNLTSHTGRGLALHPEATYDPRDAHASEEGREKMAKATYLVHAGNCHDDLVNSLANMTSLVRLRYGNLDDDVNSLISKADDILAYATASPDPDGDGDEALDSHAELILEDLWAVEDGWAGPGSKAPSEETICEIGRILSVLKVDGETVPEVECDSDGVVTLVWRRGASPFLSMVFRGNGNISVIQRGKVPASRSVHVHDTTALLGALWKSGFPGQDTGGTKA